MIISIIVYNMGINILRLFPPNGVVVDGVGVNGGELVGGRVVL